MFPESSTWRADVVRVTADGRRVPVEQPWSGYRWDELVPDRGLQLPRGPPPRRRRPRQPARVPRVRARLGRGEHAARRRDALPRGEGDGVAQRRPAAGRGPPEPCPRGRGMSAAAVRASAGRRGLTGRFDELLGRAVSMRALALLRVLAGPVVLLHLRPFLADAWHGRIYRDAFYEPYAAWYPELPRAVYVGAALARRRGRGRDVARPAHPRGDGDDVRGRRLQPVPLHHALPQQPRLPRDRARAAGRGAVRARAVPGRVAAAPPRAAAARPAGARLAAVAAALRVRRDLRRRPA